MSQRGHEILWASLCKVFFNLFLWMVKFSGLWNDQETISCFSFFAAFQAFCEPFLYVFERDTAIGLQLSPTKQLWPRHPCVCIDIGVYEIHLCETISSDQVIKMLIKMKVRQTKKTKKALAGFTGTHNDTKGLALFLYWSLKHGPEDSTVYQMLLNAYSMRPHNWP